MRWKEVNVRKREVKNYLGQKCERKVMDGEENGEIWKNELKGNSLEKLREY